ncbi:zinc finger protein 664 [Drosophila elegans]|uniref:zinc finger protein 664 n=1 Tax=Drosophila elegans TaxID=30023 RepID=UPI0007E6C28E|nr:zinc finger protein 664 [Drosophila elegans]
MEDLCRICGHHSQTLVAIFVEHERQELVEQVEPNLADMVKTCADVQLDPGDSLPQNICIACVHDARTAYGFKRRCEESHRKFYLAICDRQLVKEEPMGNYLDIEELFHSDLDLKEEFIDESPQEATAKEESHKIVTKPKPKTGRKPKVTKKQSFKCELCTKEFGHQRVLLEHMKVHSNSHVCRTCEERFLFKTDLDKHQCYRTSDSTIECPICLKVFSTTRSRDSHKCQEVKERSFQCPHCPQTFTHNHILKAHLSIHPAEEYSQGNGPHKCSHCHVGFTNKSALQVHIHAHMGQRPHTCPFCASSFRSKQVLQVHIRTHTGEKPYKCPHCPKNFSDHNNLAKHRRRHTDERPYKCSICLQDFREKHHLKRHFLGKHRDSDQELQLK